jgi:FdhD protein
MLNKSPHIGILNAFIRKYSEDNIKEHEDQVAIEQPLELRLKYFDGHQYHRIPLSVTMRTPVHDTDLVRGFLFTEAIVKQSPDILSLKVIAENIIEAELNPEVRPDTERLKRHFYTTSSCGVCGKASIESVQTENVYLPWSCQSTVNVNIITGLNKSLTEGQTLFGMTGGIHASALFDFNGKLLLLREDVGRHNAMDKLIGAFMEAHALPILGIVMVSGRASFELVQKASMAGIPILVAVGAPSSLAVELALTQGMTLIGFLRADRFNIYSCPERILI